MRADSLSKISLSSTMTRPHIITHWPASLSTDLQRNWHISLTLQLANVAANGPREALLISVEVMAAQMAQVAMLLASYIIAQSPCNSHPLLTLTCFTKSTCDHQARFYLTLGSQTCDQHLPSSKPSSKLTFYIPQ